MSKNDEMDKVFDDGIDESMYDENDEITFVDDEGNEKVYVILAEVEEGGKDYAVLGAKTDLDDETTDSVEYLIFQMVEDEAGDTQLVEIEDDEVWERLVTFVKTDLFAEEEDYDEDEDEEDTDPSYEPEEDGEDE
ncbi:MAG: DUF1292 domain-containing protein [Deltaproteobacteria bacterium]|nr:DUF1292 domain-containing protein [Deltaproteobacteria bacterium]